MKNNTMIAEEYIANNPHVSLVLAVRAHLYKFHYCHCELHKLASDPKFCKTYNIEHAKGEPKTT
jgi:hypothetical protein